jgi:acyl carrier protein
LTPVEKPGKPTSSHGKARPHADSAFPARARPMDRHGANGSLLTRLKRLITVTTTFDKVADIISETSEIPREEITPESHTIDDLGIDSLDFLDIVFAIDKEFGIKIPLETWTQEVNDGKASTEEYFVMKNLCGKIDDLVKAKAA